MSIAAAMFDCIKKQGWMFITIHVYPAQQGPVALDNRRLFISPKLADFGHLAEVPVIVDRNAII